MEPRWRPCGDAEDQRERFSLQADLEGEPTLPAGQSQAVLQGDWNKLLGVCFVILSCPLMEE